MKVIITGGSGRAGTHTVREFADAGHEVINLDVKRPEVSLPGGFIQLDLTDAGEVYDALIPDAARLGLSPRGQPVTERLSAAADLCQQRAQHLQRHAGRGRSGGEAAGLCQQRNGHRLADD